MVYEIAIWLGWMAFYTTLFNLLWVAVEYGYSRRKQTDEN